MSKRKSGWQREKESEEKQRRELAVLSSTPVISGFFKPMSSGSKLSSELGPPAVSSSSPTDTSSSAQTLALDPGSSEPGPSTVGAPGPAGINRSVEHLPSGHQPCEFPPPVADASDIGSLPPTVTSDLMPSTIATSRPDGRSSTMDRPVPTDTNYPAQRSQPVPMTEPASPRRSSSNIPKDRGSLTAPHRPDNSAGQMTNIQTDPGLWQVTEELRSYWIREGPERCSNRDSDFRDTKRAYSSQSRYLQRSMFSGTLPNGQTTDRSWLIYSPAKKCVYCFCCRLLSADRGNQFVGSGFNDWKHPNLISQHESSANHRSSLLALFSRQAVSGTVDASLERQYLDTRNYWRNVLQRLVSVVSLLAERGLAFRGSDDLVGSPANGNYLGIIELISKFDPFLAQHIQLHANSGKGHTSYLSKTVCEELINIMGKTVLKKIIREVTDAYYFSLSVDSTPDISHVDQLTIIVRYMQPVKEEPTERFLGFVPILSHSGESLANTVLEFLRDTGIDITRCRGQTYDNASNMSGRYSGMQKLIKDVVATADYIPCAAHSLNLVGAAAVGSCPEAVSFFGLVQQIYNFFSASTHRWSVISNALSKKQALPKQLSQTRWSARADAIAALRNGFGEFCDALESIEMDETQNGECRHETRCILTALNTLEMGILCELWHDILQRFDACSRTLQSPNIDLTAATALLKSLIEFLAHVRSNFEAYELKGKQLSDCDEYRRQHKRVRRRARHFDEPQAAKDAQFTSAAEHFRVTTFCVVIDHLVSAMTQRANAYSLLSSRFSFLTKWDGMTGNDIHSAVTAISEAYPNDLSPDFSSEFDQFTTFVEHQERATGQARSAASLYSLLKCRDLQLAFPNVEIALKIFLSLMITNCSGERSFSKLKLIKNELRSTMLQNRLNALSLMSIERSLLREIDFSDVIEQFAGMKARRKPL